MSFVKRLALLALLLVTVGCNNDSPTDPLANGDRGRLAGTVTIGPNCPGPTTTQPCPTPPSAYSLRKILVYNEAKSSLLFTVDIDSQGLYYIDLKVGTYTIDFKGETPDRTADLPKKVTILKNQVTPLNVSIDTGIR